MARILITGAGGPAAICFFEALAGRNDELFMADMGPYATGLYLVDSDHRMVCLAGAHDDFADHLLMHAKRLGIDRIVSTVDAELIPLAEKRHAFAAAGIELALSDARSLASTLDKYRLVRRLTGLIPCPVTTLWVGEAPAGDGPWIAKPRSGSGSRGVRLVTKEELHTVPTDGEWILQQHLPGEEYSVDVLIHEGQALGSVPRVRLRVNRGVAVTAVTVRDSKLEHDAVVAAVGMGLTGICNVQFKRDELGVARLLEINPRPPGTMALTVAAGANLPAMWMDGLDGKHVAPTSFREIGVVRMFSETVVPAGELLGHSASTEAA